MMSGRKGGGKTVKEMAAEAGFLFSSDKFIIIWAKYRGNGKG